ACRRSVDQVLKFVDRGANGAYARAMSAALRQIVAFGGGGFSIGSDNALLDEYVLGLLAPARPKVCFMPTASGDADHYVLRFYRAFSSRCETSHVTLFRRDSGVGD